MTNIDERIAVEVMGWRCYKTKNPFDYWGEDKKIYTMCETGPANKCLTPVEQLPDFSTSISDAWRVVEKMREKGWLLTLYQRGSKDLFSVEFDGDGARTEQLSGTAPMAICLAALAAVE